ncbi:hypothetical protein [Arthrobacter roseus]|uniref:DsrE family protein n=1 Tax=Arthrobacter roseus TaxID=136274 RepID=UPI0019622F58|nr:hypothetical protein [Arthrobacter roseus]MBM7847895.1 intracellular sulfur oxidation DsrE/DsrF family protein [Arthrobacter roseus]
MNSKSVAGQGLLIHYFGAADEEKLAPAFRSAQNALVAMPEAAIEVVVQGPAVALLAHNSAMAEVIGATIEGGIAVVGCGNSMRTSEINPSDLLPGVVSVPAAVAHLAQRQWQTWAYVRL